MVMNVITLDDSTDLGIDDLTCDYSNRVAYSICIVISIDDYDRVIANG